MNHRCKSLASTFFNSLLNGTSRYLNFGTATGSAGYGFRDSSGTLEFKNSGGAWNSVNTATSGPSFSVHKNGTAQTVTQSVATKLTWSTEVFDTNNNFASDTFTPTIPGKYVVYGSVYCPNANALCVAQIYKNGGAVASQWVQNATGVENVPQVTAIVDMNGSTDYLELYGQNNAGTTINGASAQTYFTGALLAPVYAGAGGGWTNDGTSSYLIDNADLVGIGSSTPYAKLTVQNTGSIPSFIVEDQAADPTPFVISANGDVGIGTTTPSRTITVAGTTYLGATTTVAGHILPLTDDVYDLGSTALRFRDLYLGGETLHLGTSLTDEATFGYNTTSNVLNIGADGTTNGDIAFFSDDLYLDKSTGRVGIGTTSPQGELNVVSTGTGVLRGISSYQYSDGVQGALLSMVKARGTASAPTTVANGDYLGQIGFTGFGTTFTNRAAIQAKVNGTVSSDSVPTDLLFLTGSTAISEAMRITSGGNVGIGTTTPSSRLHVYQSTGETIGKIESVDSSAGLEVMAASAAYPYIKFYQGGTGQFEIGKVVSDGNFYFDNNINQGGANAAMVISNSGNVGVGATNPNNGKLEVKGGTVCVDTDSDDNASSCIASESDERLKENIETLNASSSLEILRALNPVSFDWRIDDAEVAAHYPLIQRFADNPHSIGLIAQEVELLLPEAISLETVGDAEVQYFQLDYTKFIPILISGFQELDERTKMLAEVVAPLTEGSESLWDRLMTLADGFADGVLTLTGVRVEEIQSKRLCLEDVCVTRDQLRALLNDRGTQLAPQASEDSPSEVADNDPDAEQDEASGDDVEVADVGTVDEGAADTDFDLDDSATSTDDETAADTLENIASSAPVVSEEVATSSPSAQ